MNSARNTESRKGFPSQFKAHIGIREEARRGKNTLNPAEAMIVLTAERLVLTCSTYRCESVLAEGVEGRHRPQPMKSTVVPKKPDRRFGCSKGKPNFLGIVPRPTPALHDRDVHHCEILQTLVVVCHRRFSSRLPYAALVAAAAFATCTVLQICHVEAQLKTG